MPYGVELDHAQARRALQESPGMEARIDPSASSCLRDGVQATDSVYSPFARVARDRGYEGHPALEPSPFFTTLDGYSPPGQRGPLKSGVRPFRLR